MQVVLRSTTFVFKVSCTLYKILEFSATRLGSNAAAPRRRAARHARTPGSIVAGLGVHATCRPRPDAGRGMSLPHAPRPEAPGSPPGRAHSTDRAVPARCVPRTAGPSAAPTVRVSRTVGPSVAPAVRAPSEAAVPRPHLQGHALVSASEPPYLNRAPFPLLAPPPLFAAPSAPPPVSSPPRPSSSAPILLEPPLDPVGPIRVACSPSRALVVVRTEPPRPPPPTIAVHPLRQLLRPNAGHPQALGEHVVVPHRFPGWERGWLAGIRPAPPPPHAKALIASPK
jgi:hypothetical protein